ncbi:hypothetical protein EON66_04850 [archaeon]|nr:MAG: hypothetical protein EON66_04850 [archaeon]
MRLRGFPAVVTITVHAYVARARERPSPRCRVLAVQTISHRIYSKLTQRRSLIRRVICNVFFEFVFETERHNGIAEMLEILARCVCACVRVCVYV